MTIRPRRADSTSCCTNAWVPTTQSTPPALSAARAPPPPPSLPPRRGGPDPHPPAPALGPPQPPPPLLRRQRARQQQPADAAVRQVALQRAVVLAGEHLRRRHQRGLVLVGDGRQQGVHGDR